MSSVRAGAILIGFLALTLPLLPIQAVLCALAPQAAQRLPCWYHRQVCRLLGLRLHVTGTLAEGPVLLAANHASWLDIPVLSAVAPVAFIAKREVANWPFIGTLARLQRTIFVDRTARGTVRQQAATVRARVTAGETVVLFAEGTTGDGVRVLPFKSTLFSAALGSNGEAGITVQTVAIAYTKLHGMPLGRDQRPAVAWYGDMTVMGHAWHVLGLGPIDVQVHIGPPLAAYPNRKHLAQAAENAVRMQVRESLRRLS